MPEPLCFALTLDIAVEEPAPVLEAAARELVRRRHAASTDEAQALLGGDVGKALTVLIELHDLTSAGAVVLQIQSGSAEPIPTRAALPPAAALADA